MSAVQERAQELLEERRVSLFYDSPSASYALVAGREAFYRVTADRRGVRCECPVVGRACSHRLAAMAAWHDRAVREEADAAAREVAA